MNFRIVLVMLFVFVACNSKANDVAELTKSVNSSVALKAGCIENHFSLKKSFVFDTIPTKNVGITQTDNDFFIAIEQDSTTTKFKRGKAIIFTLLTGIFGGHRIYFGTHHRTPIIYSVTLGGLGILPLVDLIHIIFTKDLSKFDDNSQIIMWGK